MPEAGTTVLTLNGKTYTIVPQGPDLAVLGPSAASTGTSPVTLDTHVFSENNAGSEIIVDGTLSIQFSPSVSATPLISHVAVVTVGSDILTFTQQGFGTGQSTLSFNRPAVTLSGHVVSEVGSGIVLDGTTTVAWSSGSTFDSTSAAKLVALVAVDGTTLTANQQSPGVAVFGGHTTLSAGGAAITIGGQVVSEAVSGAVVDQSSTVLFSATTSVASITTALTGTQTTNDGAKSAGVAASSSLHTSTVSSAPQSPVGKSFVLFSALLAVLLWTSR